MIHFPFIIHTCLMSFAMDTSELFWNNFSGTLEAQNITSFCAKQNVSFDTTISLFHQYSCQMCTLKNHSWLQAEYSVTLYDQ